MILRRFYLLKSIEYLASFPNKIMIKVYLSVEVVLQLHTSITRQMVTQQFKKMSLAINETYSYCNYFSNFNNPLFNIIQLNMSVYGNIPANTDNSNIYVMY